MENTDTGGGESLRSLFWSNMLTLAVALAAGWDTAPLMWIYWCQSMIIGWHSFRRMRLLKNFTSSGMTMNDAPVPETEKGRNSVADFFALHYGFFHLGYCVFLFSRSGGLGFWDKTGVFSCALAFYFNHAYSFRANLARDLARKPNIGFLMFFPYLRVIPMHLAIILGAESGYGSRRALAFFILLKTGSDMLMHHIEHRSRHFSGPEGEPPPPG